MEKNYPKTVNENNNNIIKNILFSGYKSEINNKKYSCKKIYQECINCLSINDVNECNKKYLKYLKNCS